MTQEIESIKPALSVILDDGDFIINSTGPVGKLMAQAVLPLMAQAKRVVITTDGEMKVMKRSGEGNGAINGGVGQVAAAAAMLQSQQSQQASAGRPNPANLAQRAASRLPDSSIGDLGPDIQDQFAADLAAGRTGEQAMGEQPSPTPGPNDPLAVPAAPPAPASPARRKPVIYQDAAAPPAPELAEEQMAQILREAAEADADAARVAEDQRFQRQQAVQAGVDPAEAAPSPAADPAAADPSPARPRKREPRQLATTGRPCGRCGGGGQVVGDAGFAGACPVCHGDGQVKTWDRALKVR